MKETYKASTKKAYKAPKLQNLGSVTALTQTGQRNAGGDAKGGSVMSRGQ